MVVCTVFTSSAQLLYKKGVDKLGFNFISIITNWPIILGIILYGLGAILVIMGLRGGEVTTLYPIITASYILVAFGSSYFFREIITPLRWLGILVVMVGILVVIFGEKNNEIEYTEVV